MDLHRTTASDSILTTSRGLEQRYLRRELCFRVSLAGTQEEVGIHVKLSKLLAHGEVFPGERAQKDTKPPLPYRREDRSLYLTPNV